MKKILFISREFYPLANANTTCMENLLLHLGKEFEIDVVTTKRKIFSKREEKKFNTKIQRFNIMIENLIYLRNGLIDCISRMNIPPATLNFVREILMKCLKWLQPYIERNGFYYPESWKNNIVNKLTQDVDLQSYNWIFAIGYPFDNIEVAYQLKKANPSLKFAIIELDLYTQNPVLLSIDSEESYHERLVKENEWYSSVDKLIVTSEVKKGILSNKEIKIDENKLYSIEMPVLNNLLDSLPSRRSIIKAKNSINLVYTGMFYEDIRNPEFLFKLLSKVFDKNPNVKLHIVGFGCNNRIYQFRADYPNNVFFYGKKGKEFATNAILDADYLINIGNNTTSQVPSKIIEYIGSGKPIINFYSIEEDMCIGLLEKYPFSISIKEDHSKLSVQLDCILEFIKRYDNCYNISPEILDEFDKYRPEVVAMRIKEIIG